ncbi:MAG: DUF4258 domain-containing protein [Pseudomonadota bacterium]
MKQIVWDEAKAAAIKANHARNIIFERCVIAIENGDILDDRENPVRDGQRILVLEIDDYAYVIPYVEDQENIYLKTVYPSRKYTRKFLNR